MAYSIRLPDGTLVENIPDEVTPQQAKAKIIAAYPQFAPAPDASKSGFVPAVKAGYERLMGDVASLGGKLGITSIEEAEASRAKREAAAEAIHQPTQKGWTEEPWTKFKETLGGSLPYMAAPLAAGAAAASAPVTGALGIGAGVAGALGAGLAGTAQYTATNLGRQIEEGKSLRETELGPAFGAAIPQAALNAVGLRFLPGIRKLLGAAGKEVTVEQAKAIVKQGIARTAADYAATTGRTMGVEGLTEVGQQFLERMQAGLNLTDAKARDEYWESLIGGAVVGGALSPAGRFIERGQIKGKAAEAELGERREAEQAAQAERLAAKTQEEADKVAARQAWVDSLGTMSYGELVQTQEALNATKRTIDNRVQIKDDIKLIEEAKKAKLMAEVEPGYERARIAAEQEKRAKAAGYPAKKSAEAFEEAEAARVGRIAQTERGMADIAALANAPVVPPERFTPAQREANIVETERGMANIAELANQPVPPRAAYEPTPLIRQETSFDRAAPEPRPAVVMPSTVNQIASDLDTKYTSYIPWFNTNVIGKSLDEVRATVEGEPTLVKGTSARARILRELLAPAPAAYVEPTPDATATTLPADVPAVTEAQPGVGESGVGVPSGDLGRPTTAEPAAPVGGGLASPVTPPAPRVEPEATIPTELTETPSGTQAPETIQAKKEGPAQPAAPAPTAVEAPAPAPAKKPTLRVTRYGDGSFGLDWLPYNGRPEYPAIERTYTTEQEVREFAANRFGAYPVAPDVYMRPRESGSAPSKTRETDAEREARMEALHKKAARVAAGKQWYTYADTTAPKFEALPVEAQNRWADAYTAGKLNIALADELAATVAKPAPTPTAPTFTVKTSPTNWKAPKAEAPAPAPTPAPTPPKPKPAPKAKEPSIEETEAAEEAAEEALQTAAEADVDEGPIGQAIEKVESGDLETKAQIRAFVNKLERNGVLDDVEDVREALSDREQSAEDALDTLASLLADARDIAVEERIEELREEKRDQEEAKPAPKAEAPAPAPKAEAPKAEAPKAPDDLILRVKAAKSLEELSAITREADARYPDADPMPLDDSPPNDDDRALGLVMRAATARAKELQPAEAPAPKASDNLILEVKTPKPAPKSEASKPAPKAEAPEVKHTWADGHVEDIAGRIGYIDNDIAIVIGSSRLGNPVYAGVHKDSGKRTNVDISSYTGNLFTEEQKAKLLKERERLVAEDKKNTEAFPEGPFTGATTNVVASPEFDPRYTAYLTDLMQKMGLGNIRVLLIHPKDARANREALHLHGPYASALSAGMDANEDGSVQQFGPKLKDFYIALRPGMSEAVTFETLNHELGHIIQKVAYNNASPETKLAIRAEYEAWLAKVKGGSAKDLVYALRNRETAEAHGASASDTMPAENLSSYWKSFAEWFADNTSKWATTNEKPLSVADKFFSKLAQKLRDLVAIVTGRQYPPAKSVAKFLNEMGPGSAAMWLGPSVVSEKGAPAQQSISPASQAIIDAMTPAQQPGAVQLLRNTLQGKGFNSQTADWISEGITKARTRLADRMATLDERLAAVFNYGVRDSLGNMNPILKMRQAADAGKLLLDFFLNGSLKYNSQMGVWESYKDAGTRPPAAVFDLIQKWATQEGKSFEKAKNDAGRILEAVRLNEMRKANAMPSTKNKFYLHMKGPQIDQLMIEYNASPLLKEMNVAMDESRKAIIKKMVQVGRLTPAAGAEWESVIGYVPFDRIDDFDTKFRTQKTVGKGLAQLGKLPELVGSEDRPVKNVFDNYVNTMGWLVTQTLRQDAVASTLYRLEQMQVAKRVMVNTSPERTVQTYKKGVPVFYELPSAYDAVAFNDRETPLPHIFKYMGQFSNLLRTLITSFPAFSVKQVAEDVQRAAFHSGVRDVASLTAKALANFAVMSKAEIMGQPNDAARIFGAIGLSGEYDFSTNASSAESLMQNLGLEKRSILGSTKIGALMHKLDGITRASDLAVRKAIYDQTMLETNDAALAQVRAREIINFRRRGAGVGGGALDILIQTIPFFNAYIQGMDVLYRTIVGKSAASGVELQKAKRLFYNRAMIAASIGTIYALVHGGDDEYEDMSLDKRDKTWVLGAGAAMPAPTELGIIFKAIPERVLEYFRRSGTPEEQLATEAIKSWFTAAMETYVGRVVPIPQAVRPLMEVATNHSFLTGRQLEGIHQREQDASKRVTSVTSELAKSIAGFTQATTGLEISPISIDTVLNGYFGTTAAITTAVTDAIINPDKVDRPLHKMVGLAPFTYDPVGTRRIGEFYDIREKVVSAHVTLRDMATRNPEEAEQYVERNKERLMLFKSVNATLDQLSKTRAYKSWLDTKAAAEEYSGAERLKMREEVQTYEKNMVGWLREARKELKI